MEKVDKNKKTDKKKPPIFILLLLIFMIVVLYAIYIMQLNFEPVTTIEYSGYAVSGKNLIENLLRTDLNGKKFIEPLKIEEDTVVYKKLASYFIGQEKKININLDYPIYINNNIALLNLSEDGKLISNEFEEIDIYKNSALTDGMLYNLSDFERADFNDYLFLRNSDNMFINLIDIEIKTNMNTYTIPKNSIINFRDNFIAYYHLEEDKFKYETIVDVELESIVKLNGEMAYKDLLLNLNMIKSKPEKVEENVEDNENEEETEEKTKKEKKIIRVVEHKDDKEEPANELPATEPQNTEQVPLATDFPPGEPGQGYNPGSPEWKWIKPSVYADKFEPNVYTATTNLYIHDPAGVVRTAIVFEIYKGDKVYLRNQFLSSGKIKIAVLEPDTEYEIKGIYRYVTEEKSTVEVEFLRQKIKTKDISSLQPLTLDFDGMNTGKNLYPDRIEISNLKIGSNFALVDETIIGVKRGEVIVGDRTYNMNSSDLRRLLNGQTVDMVIGGNLKSNSNYDFEIKLYDVSNNLVNLINNTGKARTSKIKPEISVKKINKKRSFEVELELSYINPDNVEIRNKKYKVYSVSKEVVAEGNISSEKIILQNLDFAKSYTIEIYGDYNLDDNRGIIENDILASYNFATAELDEFGDLHIDLNIWQEKITSNSAVLDFSINSTINKTNKELINMLKKLTVYVVKGNEETPIEVNAADLATLKSGGEVSLELTGLDSDTNYQIRMVGRIEAGTAKKDLNAIITGNKRFTTLKQDVVIGIKNLFILNNMIDFDINIYDKDGAIRDSGVTIEILDTRDETVAYEMLDENGEQLKDKFGDIIKDPKVKISKNIDELTRINIPNLSPSEKYYIVLRVDRYSLRIEEGSLKEKYFEFGGNDQRIKDTIYNGNSAGEISTNDIGGYISLDSIMRENIDATGNLIDVESEVKWYSECFNTSEKGYLKEYYEDSQTLRLGIGSSKNNTSSQMYIYDLKASYPEYNQEELEMSFKFKKSDETLKIYIQNGRNFTTGKVIELPSEGMPEDLDGYTVFNSRELLANLRTERYIGLLLEGKKNAYVDIKEFQVKLYNDETTDEEGYTYYKYRLASKFALDLNLHDTRFDNMNVTNGVYYINVRNTTNGDSVEYKYTDYANEAMGDNGQNAYKIEQYIKEIELVENKVYEIELILKNPNVEGRKYILTTIEVDTGNKEIKNIKDINGYLEIQPNGSYIFSNDMNLNTGDYRFGNEGIIFGGNLDFNGKKVLRTIAFKEDTAYKYYLFYGFSEKAKIQNLYFDFEIDLGPNITINTGDAGLVYENFGTIKNIIVNFRKGTYSPIRQFAIIANKHSGTLENFVIYLKSNFYLGGEGALGVYTCRDAIIRNGYIASAPYRTYYIKPINCTEYRAINIAVLAAHVKGSRINNVYSLVTINNTDDFAGNNPSSAFYAGNLLADVSYEEDNDDAKGESIIKNIYSVGIGNITKEHSVNQTVGPTIAYPYNSEDRNLVENSYFFYEEENVANNEYNVRVGVAALANQEFQYNVLNSPDSNKQFIVNSTVKEFFPKLKMPSVMPKQYNIPMIKSEETDADILFVNPIEDGETEKTVEITVYNPRESKIDKIEVEDLEVDQYRVHSEKYCKPGSDFEKCSGNHDEEGYCLDKNGNRILVEEDGYTQEYISGKTTKLVTKIRIPTEETLDAKGFDSRRYVNKYYLKSIKARGYEEKKYIDDNGIKRIINELRMSFYYKVQFNPENPENPTLADLKHWRRINEYPDQNYRIVTDIDFNNYLPADYSISKVFTGVLSGKYKDENGQERIATLKNIGKETAETKLNLFYRLDNARVENIRVDGFEQLLDSKNQSTGRYTGGLIGVINKGTIVDDIHIKNAKITIQPNVNNADVFYIGGLASEAKLAIIRNCSVTYKPYKNSKTPNFVSTTKNSLKTARLGGLIGYVEEINITNCFVRDIYMNVSVATSEGLGGLCGAIKGGKIFNSYATGQIRTNASNIGGIFGNGIYLYRHVKVIPNEIEGCFALVNIRTDGTGLGGIGGIQDSHSLAETKNNVSLGNLYTSVVGKNVNLNRVIGTVATDKYENYGFRDQTINGFKVTETDSNYKRGAQYVATREDIKNNISNNDRKMFDEAIYDVSGLAEENMPLLKYTESDEILPNQEEPVKLPINPTLEIISVKSVERKGEEWIQVKIKDEGDTPVPSDSITLEVQYLNIENVEYDTYEPQTKMHTVYLKGKPIYALDSYEIISMGYGDNPPGELSVKVDYIQYIELDSPQKWAEEFCTNYSGYRYSKTENDGKLEFLPNQNYKITGDIDLEEVKALNGGTLPTNLMIGRIAGTEEKHKIYNTNLSFTVANSGLFREIARELSDVTFEDINIENTAAYTGIIAKCSAQEIRNVDFRNIVINSETKKNNYVGCIAYNSCVSINDIYLENITCYGLGSVGGFVGYSYPGVFDNIVANNIKINPTESGYIGGSNVGGIFGVIIRTTAYKNLITNLSISDSLIKSNSGSYIGGIVGQFNCSSAKEFYVKNVKIDCNNGTYVGGFAGYTYWGTSSVYINGINIKTNGGTTVGGVFGHSASSETDIYIEGYVDGTNVYNIVNAPNAQNVGGIAGFTWGTFNRNYVKNLVITGKNNVGGILGLGHSVGIVNSMCQLCEITGNTNVGGTIGTIQPDAYTRATALTLYNTYNDSKVVATGNEGVAGGIIGYLNNSRMNNKTYVSSMYRNYAGGTDIRAKRGGLAGALIGKLEKPVYYLNNSTKYYYSNLLVTNKIDASDMSYQIVRPIGNIDNLIDNHVEVYLDPEGENGETIEVPISRRVPEEETMSRLFNSVFYEYVYEGGHKALRASDLNSLKDISLYKDTLLFGNNNANYTYTDINIKFPILYTMPKAKTPANTFADGTTKTYMQTGIFLPEQSTTLTSLGINLTSLSSSQVETLPTYNIYASDVNKINIDFSKTSDKLYFAYKMSDGNMSEAIPIKNRTYTFEYNFNSSFEFILSNGTDEEKKFIVPTEVHRLVSVNNGNYYYIDGSDLVENGVKTSNGSFVNLFNGKALKTTGEIYDLNTHKVIGTVSGTMLVEETMPIQKFIYHSNIVETYYHYLKIIGEQENIANYQMFTKNGNIFILDGSLKTYGDSIIVDSFNNKEYQTVLGLDGTLYDLKDKINYPENFVNENILQMTNNIDKDGNTILILYEDGRAYAFNYITGNVIFDSNEKAENFITSLFNNLRNLTKSSPKLYEANKEEYEEAVELEEKLKEIPIEDVQLNLTNSDKEAPKITKDEEVNNPKEVKVDNTQEYIDDETNNDSETSKTTGQDEKDGKENAVSGNNKNIKDSEGNKAKAEKAKTSENSNKKNDYATVYDSETNSYLVYKVASIIGQTEESEVAVSETEKLNRNPELKEYYEIAEGKQTTGNSNGIYLIAGSIVVIIGILGVMYRKKNY